MTATEIGSVTVSVSRPGVVNKRNMAEWDNKVSIGLYNTLIGQGLTTVHLRAV